MELKAELIMVIKDYECEERQRRNEGIDLTASNAKSDDKILLRLITEPKSKSGIITVDDVKNMVETMEKENYDKGVIISKRFSKAARREVSQEKIQMISEKNMPRFKPQRIYLTIRDCIDDLCKTKCCLIPEKESDCKGYHNGYYSCKIRLISDNASFHLERGWTNLLQEDLMQLLAIQHSINN
jgi:hypothetical protein